MSFDMFSDHIINYCSRNRAIF